MMMSTCRRRAQVEWPIFADPKDATTTHPNCSVISFFDFEFKKEDRYFFFVKFFFCGAYLFLFFLSFRFLVFCGQQRCCCYHLSVFHYTQRQSSVRASCPQLTRTGSNNIINLISTKPLHAEQQKTRQDKIKKKQATN